MYPYSNSRHTYVLYHELSLDPQESSPLLFSCSAYLGSARTHRHVFEIKVSFVDEKLYWDLTSNASIFSSQNQPAVIGC